MVSMKVELQELIRLAGATGAARWEWDKEKDALQIIENVNLPGMYIKRVNTYACQPDAKMKAPVYRAHRNGEVIKNFNPNTSGFPEAFQPWAEHFHYNFLVVMPIRMQSLTLGAVSFYFTDKSEEDPIDTVLFNLLLDRVALGIIQEEHPEELEVFLAMEQALNNSH